MCYASHKKTPEKLEYVSGIPYNSDMFKSYWYVCTNCDASIEVVSKGIHFQDPTCNCHDSQVVWCQTSVVESDTNLTKEENMLDNLEASMEEPSIPQSYNPNLLVTYKKIDNNEVSYPTEKVTDIEWALDQSRRNYKNLTEKQNSWYSKESQLRTLIEDAYADSEDQETLASIAEIFDIALTKEIEYTAWVRVDMTVEVELGGDVDAIEDFISQNLTVDSYDGLIQVNGYDVDRVEEGAY